MGNGEVQDSWMLSHTEHIRNITHHNQEEYAISHLFYDKGALVFCLFMNVNLISIQYVNILKHVRL